MSKTRRRRHSHNAKQCGYPSRLMGRDSSPISAMPPQKQDRTPPVVSDHAVVRWMERAIGIDVRAKAENHILGEGREQVIATIGSGRIKLPGFDLWVVVRGGRVATVEPCAE